MRKLGFWFAILGGAAAIALFFVRRTAWYASESVAYMSEMAELIESVFWSSVITAGVGLLLFLLSLLKRIDEPEEDTEPAEEELYAEPYAEPYADPYAEGYAAPYVDPYADPYAETYAPACTPSAPAYSASVPYPPAKAPDARLDAFHVAEQNLDDTNTDTEEDFDLSDERLARLLGETRILPDVTKRADAFHAPEALEPEPREKHWICAVCGCSNPDFSRICAVCGSSREGYAVPW